MDFSLSKSEKLVVESVREFLDKETKEIHQEPEEFDQGYSPEIWKKMADLGWIGIMIPEEYGGVAGDFVELVLILEEIGRAGLLVPFVSTVCSGLAILKNGNEEQKEKLLPGIAEGKLIITPAFMLAEVNPSGDKMEEKVESKNGTYAVTGTRLFVPYASSANYLVYETVTEEGETLFLIDTAHGGVECNLLPTIVPRTCWEVRLAAVGVPKENVLGERGQGNVLKSEIADWGALCQSAFILGLLERILEMSVSYAKKREQFGRPIGSFQAIWHHCANMATEVDKVKYLTYQAAWKLGQGVSSRKEIAMAKARASEASRSVSVLGIKIHGGVGISREYDLQFYFRLAKLAEIAFGDGNFHRETVAQQIGL